MHQTLSEVLNTFDHHRPTDEQVERIQNVRTAAKVFATALWDNCPQGADLAVALRTCHEAMMNGTKSIVLEGEDGPR